MNAISERSLIERSILSGSRQSVKVRAEFAASVGDVSRRYVLRSYLGEGRFRTPPEYWRE